MNKKIAIAALLASALSSLTENRGRPRDLRKGYGEEKRKQRKQERQNRKKARGRK